MLRLISPLRRGVAVLAGLMGLLAGWGFVLCAFFIAAEVLSRWVLRISTGSTTEISGYMLAFGLSWGMAHALAQRSHVRIDMLVNRLPQRARVPLHLAALAALGVFTGFMAKGAWDLVEESLLFNATDISLLRIPLAIPQGIWAFGLLVFLLLVALMFLENVLLALSGEFRAVERNLTSRGYHEEAAEALEALGVKADRR